METSEKWQLVNEPKEIALAAIERKGRYLIALRPGSAELGGLWEFPGGKIEHGESPAEAAERECREELGCSVEPLRSLDPIEHDYGNFSVRLWPVLCDLGPNEEPRALSASRLQWVTLAALRELRIPEANHRLIETIEDASRAGPPGPSDGSPTGKGQGVP